MIKIAPSMLSCDFARFGEETARMECEGADLIHMDVMDAHFVPNLTFGAPIIKAMRKYASIPFDVHLMISDPLKYAEDFAKAGADIITFHVESDSPVEETINKIKSLGVKAALSVKPKTPVEEVLPYLESLDMVLIMTVEPGFGGQSFMADMPKVKKLREEIIHRGLDIDIQVDGGISDKTIAVAAENGANVFVAGSAVFAAPDSQAMIATLKQSAAEAYGF